MSSVTVLHNYQFKRGKEETLERVNPVLNAGEPVTVFCKDGKVRMKLGDGKTSYCDLNFTGEIEIAPSVISANSYVDFPSVGAIDTIYIDVDEGLMYRWDASINDYAPIGGSSKDEGQCHITTTSPTKKDNNYPILSYWLNTKEHKVFILVSIENKNANWVCLNEDSGLNDELANLSSSVDTKFKAIDENFKSSNSKFENIDENFENINQNFKNITTQIDDAKKEIYEKIKAPVWGTF